MATTDGTVDIDTAKLRLARLRAGLSCRGVARRAEELGRKVDFGNYSRYERGDRRPYPHTAAALAEVLGVDIADLLKDDAA
jgi:transcriptional regulator with XRE-family HTH domain